jgi:RNA polymerase sigma factor (sigma-70 family)
MPHLLLSPGVLTTVQRSLRGLGTLSDADLLQRYIERTDEQAFEQLVHRHGLMVLRLAQRLVADDHLAEDVFQATFLLLARQPRSVRKRESLGSWLHGVAYRLAKKQQVQQARQRRLETHAAGASACADPLAQINGRELLVVLDEELHKLSETHRAPLVLCYLEGATRDEAARQLGWAVRTLKRRLQQGRARLRARLEKRGFGLSGVVGPPGLAASVTGKASLPGPLMRSTTQAALLFARRSPSLENLPISPNALTLAEGALATMNTGLCKILGLAALILGFLGLGLGLAQQGPPKRETQAPPAQSPPVAVAAEQAKPRSKPVPPASRAEVALMAGLDWLARQQQREGHWQLLRPAGEEGAVAGTAIGLLPFLVAGESQQGAGPLRPHAGTIRRGLNYLLQKQGKKGEFPGSMYTQALATWALCLAYQVSQDPHLKEAAQRAVDYIIWAQHNGGGWRYRPRQPGDTSVTGWQVLALSEAQRLGLAVPKKVFQASLRYLTSAGCAAGGYSYVPGTGRASPSMTAAGLLGVLLLDSRPDKDTIAKAQAILANHPPAEKVTDIYYYHFATRALARRGGKPWEQWRPAMTRWLLAHQEQKAGLRGSWDHAPDQFSRTVGRVMMTSFSLLTLELCTNRTRVVRNITPPATVEQAETYFAALGEASLWQSRRLVQSLAGNPKVTLAVLRPHLRPVKGVRPGRLKKLIAQLDDDRFLVRQQAARELRELGELAHPALRQALSKGPSLEARKQIQQLLEASQKSTPEQRQTLLAIEVLRQIKTPQARQLLQQLAGGAPGASLTQQARHALEEERSSTHR